MDQGTVISDHAMNELIETLYDSYYQDLCKYAYRCMGNSSNAEDVVQTTFLIAHTKVNDVSASPNQIGWLYRTLQNVMRNKRREQTKMQKLLLKLAAEPNKLHSTIYENDENLELLLQGLIKPMDLKLLIQFYIEGYSQMELAEQLGISLSACKMRILRAKAVLRKALSTDQEKQEDVHKNK